MIDADSATEQPEPDLRFSLGVTERPDPVERSRVVTRQLARELAASAPEGWRRLDAVFALTVVDEAAELAYTDGERSVHVAPSEKVVRAVRELRALSAELGDGPWLRLTLSLTSEGALEVDHDYGDEPFDDAHVFPADAYRADLAAFPRSRIPTWLAAHIEHGGRQVRTPQQAAESDTRSHGGRAVAELPALPALWARWATLAAVSVGAGVEAAPTMLPSLAWFEDGRHSGATLYRLSDDRAVLSGGRLDSAELAAGYDGSADLPELYAGAPQWVSNAVLNPRAAGGMLSFCYWWQHDSWRCGESPEPTASTIAAPQVWTEDAVVDRVVELIAAAGDTRPATELAPAAESVLGSAEIGLVTRDLVAALVAGGVRFDVDAAFAQFDMAGLTAPLRAPLPAQDAIALVRDYILDRGAETPGYPVSGLVATRVEVGWMVHVPATDGAAGLGRAVFYVADDGVLERSSSSTRPADYAVGFERRFRQRRGATVG